MMSQTIEIELKNELIKDEYEKIKAYFRLLDDQFFLQENHYFDTPDFALKNKKSALRIRKKSDSFELTLKQPAENGLLESNQLLTESQAMDALEKNIIPKGLISRLITEMMIDINQLCYFGALQTKRAEWHYKQGLLVLDYSTYLNHEDYELEYEVCDLEKGQEHFVDLLSTLQIPSRPTENKVKRFYNRKYSLWNS